MYLFFFLFRNNIKRIFASFDVEDCHNLIKIQKFIVVVERYAFRRRRTGIFKLNNIKIILTWKILLMNIGCINNKTGQTRRLVDKFDNEFIDRHCRYPLWSYR